MKMIHRGEKGFTLIELLVVIAILGVIAAVVALNVGNFFGRGTVQAANTELHQVQTAVTSAMAECEAGALNFTGLRWWSGGSGVITANCTGIDGSNDAAFYVYGPFRAAYLIDNRGRIRYGCLDKECTGRNATNNATVNNPWTGIQWSDANKNWEVPPRG